MTAEERAFFELIECDEKMAEQILEAHKDCCEGEKCKMEMLGREE